MDAKTILVALSSDHFAIVCSHQLTEMKIMHVTGMEKIDKKYSDPRVLRISSPFWEKFFITITAWAMAYTWGKHSLRNLPRSLWQSSLSCLDCMLLPTHYTLFFCILSNLWASISIRRCIDTNNYWYKYNNSFSFVDCTYSIYSSFPWVGRSSHFIPTPFLQLGCMPSIM